jgi:Icc protein
MRLLHLSDTHLDRLDEPNAHGVNTRASLTRMLKDCREVRNLDAIVISGDIADDGSREAYSAALDLIGAFAHERAVPMFYSTGNHDERKAFSEILGSGHLDATGSDRTAVRYESADGERAAASEVAGYRIITLDSLVPGMGYGVISQGQLDWLRAVLAEPAPSGTVLAFHHPPIMLDVEVQHALGLQNATELAAAIRGTDVKMILCGHFHLQISGQLEATPVWVTPGVVARIDLTGVPGTERAVRGASASVVDLGGPYSPLLHVLHARDPQVGEIVYELDADQLTAVIAKVGPT